MSDWYDKKGNPLVTATDIDSPEWREQMHEVEKLLRDTDYKIVKQEYTPKKQYRVSTVWLGLDHNFGGGKPLIFETMVFSGRRDTWFKWNGKRRYTSKDHAQVRYATEEEAIRGHKKLLEEFTKLEGK